MFLDNHCYAVRNSILFRVVVWEPPKRSSTSSSRSSRAEVMARIVKGEVRRKVYYPTTDDGGGSNVTSFIPIPIQDPQSSNRDEQKDQLSMMAQQRCDEEPSHSSSTVLDLSSLPQGKATRREAFAGGGSHTTTCCGCCWHRKYNTVPAPSCCF